METLAKTDLKEQETIINLDYSKKQAILYTCRKTQLKKFTEKLGEPTKKYYINNFLSGAVWIIPFKDKKQMNIVLSKTLLIGNC